MVCLLFLFSPKQTILQARACIQRQRQLVTKSAAGAGVGAQQKALVLASLHDDALNLLAEVVEIPQYGGLVLTENVCFHTKVPIVGFESLIDASGTNATIKKRIAYYYTTKHVPDDV